MKRSKLFLGATTCILAIAGVAAAKSNFASPARKGYYCTKPGTAGHCVAYATSDICPSSGPTLVCKVSLGTPAQLYTLYTKISLTNIACDGVTNHGCATPITYTAD